MPKKLFSFFLLLFIAGNSLFAQTVSITGKLVDANDQTALPGASVLLRAIPDTSKKQAQMTDASGKFEFKNLSAGAYILVFNYMGYNSNRKYVRIDAGAKDLGAVALSANTTALKDVKVEDFAKRAEQKNDTSEFTAKSYKTHPDATAEELVTKMPGITSDNGNVKAHGEQVQKVTVDGKEFFGQDATLALKNLPAEIVDKVQVFDRMSDQSLFTGFDDGNSQKSMNIVTRPGRNNGVFGKLYAGYGYLEDSKYSAGGLLNWFNGNRRITLIGMSNNVNIQNFSPQDLLGLSGGGGGRGYGGMGRGGGGSMMGGGASNNFMTSQQGGISTTHSAGLNFIDAWGKKKNFKVNGSYFFNQADNITQSDLSRKYFNSGDSALVYSENNRIESRNINHRINLRFEYAIDSLNSLIFTPKFSFQENKQSSTVYGLNSLTYSDLLSSTQTDYQSLNKAYNASAELLYQHRFRKAGRTLSMNIGGSLNDKNGTSAQQAINYFFRQDDSVQINQETKTSGSNYGVNANLAYSEPVGDVSIIQVSYSPSFTWINNDKETDRLSPIRQERRLDTLLSNKYDNTYMVHKVGLNYRMKGKAWNLMLGLNEQYGLLQGGQVFPFAFKTRRAYLNILPEAMFTCRFTNGSSLRLRYRTSTNLPSIGQLQSVIDNSNPLFLSTGNPNLDQSYNHFLMLRYGYTDNSNGQNFFAFVSGSLTQNYIGNSIFIASNDTLLSKGLFLRRGAQLSKPVNINGNWNLNSFFTYGLPIKAIKCNFNLNLGLNYSQTPGMINSVRNLSRNFTSTAGFVLGSNISEKIDFSLSYNGSYSLIKNSLQTQANNSYFTHTASLKFNWLFWKGFLFNTNVQNTLYTGVSQGFNQNIFLWNAALGYKFLKDKTLELKFSVNDILNQNSGISRNITETYLEDSRTRVLKRYLMLTLTWNLKYFKKVKE